MPFAPKHPCAAPGCPELLDRGQGSRCAKHQTGQGRTRGQHQATTAKRGYGAAWQKHSEELVKRVGCCQQCGATEDLTTHHTTKARLGGQVEDGTVVLCRSCHSWLHARERKGE